MVKKKKHREHREKNKKEMATDEHGLKKYFVVLIETGYVMGRVSVFISVNQWLIQMWWVGF